MKIISFRQLRSDYEHVDERFVEIVDKSDALNQIQSKTSSCWGAGQIMGESGWIRLASPSKQSKGDTRTVFVCKKSLVE